MLWIVSLAITLHLLLATILLADGMSNYAATYGVQRYLRSDIATAAVYYGVAALSVVGLLTCRPRRVWSIFLLLPQQFVLLLAAGSGFEIVIPATRPSGAPTTHLDALVAVSSLVLLAVFHNLAILHYHIHQNGGLLRSLGLFRLLR